MQEVTEEISELELLRTEKRRVDQALRYRLAFEDLLTTLSTRFIHSSGDDVTAEITWAVARIGEFTQVDRCFAFLITSDGEQAHYAHEWCAEGLIPHKDVYSTVHVSAFPWSMKMYKQFQCVYVPDVDALPEDAWDEQMMWRAAGTRSLVAVPIAIGKKLLGVLGLATERAQRTWEKEDIRLLEILAQIFANALERQRKDAALHRSASQFRLMADSLPVAIGIHDDERFIYVNRAAEEITGYLQNEILDGGYGQFIHPADSDFARFRLSELVNGALLEPMEVRFVARDGSERWVQVQARQIEFEDRPAYLVAAIDTTERYRAAEALRQSEEHLRLVVQNMQVMMDAMDEHGNIIVWNRECERVTGYRSDEIVGNPAAMELLYPDAAQRGRMLRAWAASGNEYREVEWHITCKDGSVKTVSWFNISGRFSIPGWASWRVGMDVTDRRRLEKQLLEVSAREQIRIGHDLHDRLGQHLTGIGFKSQLLAEELAEKNLPEADLGAAIVQMVKEAINQTRSLSHGLYPVHLEADGLMTSLEELATQTQAVYDIQCRFVCEEPMLIYDNATATHVYRIAQEAVNNAVKHAKPSFIEIALTCDADCVRLTIQDNGGGLPVQGTPGKGLGLSIMKYRARMIEGQLSVESAVDSGVLITCTFTLPEGVQSQPGQDFSA